MKHSATKLNSSLLDVFSPVLNNRESVFSVDSFSVVPFLFSLLRGKVFLSVSSSFFDDAFSSFFDNGLTLGLPSLSSGGGSFSFSELSYHKNLYNIAYNRISSSWDSFDVCVVDSSLINKKLFSSKKEFSFKLWGSAFSYERLFVFLKKNGYNKVDRVVSPGDFVVRGAVVDVFSFGSKNFFRLNFFDEKLVVYSVDLSTRVVVGCVKKSLLLPFVRGSAFSLFDFFTPGCLLASFDKNTLYIKNIFVDDGFYSYDKEFLSFDFLNFKNSYSGFRGSSSSLLTSRGLFFNDFIIFPSWFVEKKESVVVNPSLYKPLDLVVGDFYIHESFGVCCFVGFEEKKSNQDRLCLRFLDGLLKLDVLLLNKLSFYSSRSSGVRALDSLNKTKKWKARQKKAFSSAQEYVQSVVLGYVARESSKKKPCFFDADVFGLFMSGFQFKDTFDQSSSWSSVLSDLCSSSPMDRLLCGDVGFGKTEIALRAAFVSLMNKRKVVFLAPTTILAQQLFICCQKRLACFGFVVKQVSRLTKTNSLSIDSFINNNTDLLVGTHSLVRSDEVLQTAGLFIVDEEHRFGVKDKERVFLLNPSIDFLSMSATPIPRSLQFSLSNVRKISVMLSPPKLRKPIITNIYKYNKSLLRNVIFSEISRSGQVYVVDNSVDNVVFLCSFLSSFFKGLNVSFLYGGLPKKVISSTMDAFRDKKIDILVSTSIIESGIDVPLANTIIINNAHMFGLAQLYQLRGRVGRSDRQGYAFLFVPNKNELTSDAFLRLDSLLHHSRLGSGYDLALSDLNIRGPGSLFGFTQSGVSSVGFDYYNKLLNKAVRSLSPKKTSIDPSFLPYISLGQAFVPKDFIVSDKDRACLYSFLSRCVVLDALSHYLDDVVIKFGPLPLSLSNLFLSRRFSILLYHKGVSQITFDGSWVSFSLTDLNSLDFDVFVSLLNTFFKDVDILFKFVSVKKGFMFRFSCNPKDVYILTQSLIKTLYE